MMHRLVPLCLLVFIGLFLCSCESPLHTPTPTYTRRLSRSGAIALVLDHIPRRIHALVELRAQYQGNGLWHVFTPGAVLSGLYSSGPLWHVYEDVMSALPANEEALAAERRWTLMDRLQQERER